MAHDDCDSYVHHSQCVPWLITMTTDQDSAISVKACQWISDLDSRYGGFTQNQLMSGAKNSFEFQRLLGHVSTVLNKPLESVLSK